MKKLFTIVILLIGFLAANAQYAGKGDGTNSAQPVNKPVKTITSDAKTVGDTLLYCPSDYWLINPTDAPLFDWQTEDIDGLTPTNSGYFTAFGVFYDDSGDPEWWMPWDVDTAFFWGATSWFNPAGQADNWLEFGPITLPAGSDLTWYQRYNGSGGTPPFWFDGYEVLISTTGMTNYSDFTDAAVFTRADYTGSDGTDSSWIYQTVNIPGTYANQICWFAFHHNANDMDVLYLDEIKITVTQEAGINEATDFVPKVKNSPNPANEQTVISYNLAGSTHVSLQLFDIAGRELLNKDFGVQTAGTNMYTLSTSDLSAGIYYYTLNFDGTRVTNKMSVNR